MSAFASPPADRRAGLDGRLRTLGCLAACIAVMEGSHWVGILRATDRRPGDAARPSPALLVATAPAATADVGPTAWSRLGPTSRFSERPSGFEDG